MNDVVITVKLKLDWQDRLAFDRGLSHLAFRVAYAIGWHVNRHSGETHVGRCTIAEKLGITVRSVERAVAELEAAGHLEVSRGHGRGNLNVYRPAFVKKATGGSPFTGGKDKEMATQPSPFREAEKATDEGLKGDKSGDKRRHSCRSNPYSNPLNKPFEDSSSARARAGPASLEAMPSAERWTFGHAGHLELMLSALFDCDGEKGGARLARLPEARLLALCRRLRNGALTMSDIGAAQDEIDAATAADEQRGSEGQARRARA